MATAANGTAPACDEDKLCELCGKECHSEEICTVLACSYSKCENTIYHQSCVEKFLRSTGLERSRKIGFPCPRGKSKSTRFPQPCGGKIERSHPLIPRCEEKRLKKIITPEIMQQLKQHPPKPAVPTKAPGVVAQVKPATASKPKPPVKIHTVHVQSAPIVFKPRALPVVPGAAVSAILQPASETQGTAAMPVGFDAVISKAQKKNFKRQVKKKVQPGDQASVTDETQSVNTENSLDAIAAVEESAWEESVGLRGNFITDLAAYQRALGLFSNSNDDEVPAEEEDQFPVPEPASAAGDEDFEQQVQLAVEMSLAQAANDESYIIQDIQNQWPDGYSDNDYYVANQDVFTPVNANMPVQGHGPELSKYWSPGEDSSLGFDGGTDVYASVQPPFTQAMPNKKALFDSNDGQSSLLGLPVPLPAELAQLYGQAVDLGVSESVESLHVFEPHQRAAEMVLEAPAQEEEEEDFDDLLALCLGKS